MHSLFAVPLLLLLAVPGDSPAVDSGMNLEQSVCGFKEPIIFWLWSSQAGGPNKGRLRALDNIEDIDFTTGDDRKLRGYRLNAAISGVSASAPTVRGYLLVLQGNAMLADQIVGEFKDYAEAGYDVYVYDYRGYGRSEGKRRLKAMVSDYREIIDQLNSRAYRQRLVYAMSFGGIVLLDAWQDRFGLDRIVVDSSPSRLSDYGCPAAYDPVVNLPADCSRFMFVTGLMDRVVTPRMSKEILAAAKQRGAKTVREEAFGHPFMDHDWSVHQRRFRAIKEFLLQH